MTVQLSIVMPIESDLLGDMTAKDIVNAIESAKDVAGLKEKADRAEVVVQQFGVSLELILDEISGPLERAKALRDLAKEAKSYKFQ